MKVLLLGEFSALHKNLKEGLCKIGVDVTHASNGDGWKKINSDITWISSSQSILGWVRTFFSLLFLLPRLRGYDVVQLMSPVLFPRQFGVNKLIINYIIKNNKKVFLVGAGASDMNSYIADFFEKKFKYPQLYNAILEGRSCLWSQTEEGRCYNEWLHSRLHGYIPIMYEYAQGYRDVNYNKLLKTIPIPMNLDKVAYSKNIVGDKVVIFHGLIREEQKGTPLITQALKEIKDLYPNDVEIIIDGRMPLDVYLETLGRANIVIDQVYSASNGVNAVYNLAMGNVVLGGGDIESLSEYGLKKSESPLISIEANSDDIKNKLIDLIENKDTLPDLGWKSRKYAEKLHCYETVAKSYVSEWSK